MNASVSPARRRRGAVAALTAAAAALVLTGCGSYGAGDLASYDLPAKSARYTFEAETDGVRTAWEYVSDRPAKDDAPEVSPCMGDVAGDNKAACRPEPLIFLRYDLGLSLDNTVRAKGTHRIEVVAYYQDRLTAPPRVTSMKVEASFDGGRSWHRADSRTAGTNAFAVRIEHPKGEKAGRSVGLRVSAADDKGDTVVQTLPTAYRLR